LFHRFLRSFFLSLTPFYVTRIKSLPQLWSLWIHFMLQSSQEEEKKGKNLLFNNLQSNDTYILYNVFLHVFFLHVSCIHKYIIVKIDYIFMVWFITIYNTWCLLALWFRLNRHQIQILYLWIYKSHSILQKANFIVVQITKWIWVSSKLESCCGHTTYLLKFEINLFKLENFNWPSWFFKFEVNLNLL